MRILTEYSEKQQAHINIMTNLLEDAAQCRQEQLNNYCHSEKVQYNNDQQTSNGESANQQQENYNNIKPYTGKDSYIDIDKLNQDSKNVSADRFEQSYERDSRWKPHLSWSFLSWSLQQRMEEQAAQRELTWQKIADKLGPLLISDGGCTFGQADYSTKSADERAYERVPFISHNQANYHSQRHNGGRSTSRSRDSILIHNQPMKKEKQHYTKPSGRFLTVSGILILLIVLLFTLVILMALGIIPYSLHYRK